MSDSELTLIFSSIIYERCFYYAASKVLVTCSSSGKLTGSLVDHVLRLFAPSKCLQISDYWPGPRDLKIYFAVPGCKRLEISAHTTLRIQPLNVYFNRQ